MASASALSSLALAVCLLGLNIYSVYGFCYRNSNLCGPSNWGGSCQSGANQSPIDIPVLTTTFSGMRNLNQTACYYLLQNFNVTNTENRVRVTLTGDQTSSCKVGGNLLGGNYTFSHLDFHWGSADFQGSEHTLNGVRFVMEAQMVHYKEKFTSYNEAVASGERNALAAFSIFFVPARDENPLLLPIISALPFVRAVNSTTQRPGLLLRSFLGLSPLTNMYQYNGSLTIPDCSETVLWNINTAPLPISQLQLNAFRFLLTDSDGRRLVDNFRPVQKRNSRDVQQYLLFSI